jgi:hypothetical protein
MFQSITLNFTETGQMVLPMKGITVFVGPNNSGKSLVLREIESAFEVHPFPTGLHVLKSYEVEWPSEESVQATIERSRRFHRSILPDTQVIVGRLNPNGGRQTTTLNRGQLFDAIANKQDKNWFATHFLKWNVVRLDGRSRFNLTNDQGAGDLLGPPENVLASLFQDDATRLKVRALIKDAFGLHFVVDPTNLGSMRIRLSEAMPLDDEQSLNADARSFHGKAIHIKDASDGVQAFTGIITAVCSGEFDTILVDEPEAFLHPPLARKLGKNLASLAEERGGSLLASTHSPDFLMGCVQASPSVRVIRLEYREGKSRGRMIDPAVLDGFLKRPLMRSANVISALFHDGVVIAESDNDRAFYSEIYHRLAEGKVDFPSLLFINAQNKQTIKDIMGPLRQFGVPAAAVPDIDIVKDGGKIWTDWLRAAQVPDALHGGYGQQRSAIKEALDATGKDMKTDGGIATLDKENKEAANHLFDNLEKYGIFPVRNGELEDWLADLKIPGKKTDWTVAMLERLGSDPLDPSYVKPAAGDVWAFLQRIVEWIRNPARNGTN